jgi:hypothetical protein
LPQPLNPMLHLCRCHMHAARRGERDGWPGDNMVCVLGGRGWVERWWDVTGDSGGIGGEGVV